jgi:hypothetical protein
MIAILVKAINPVLSQVEVSTLAGRGNAIRLSRHGEYLVVHGGFPDAFRGISRLAGALVSGSYLPSGLSIFLYTL